jgi:hypothetical protein
VAYLLKARSGGRETAAARNNKWSVRIRDAYSCCWVVHAAYTCTVMSPNNRRGDVGSVVCGSALRLYDLTDRVLFRDIYVSHRLRPPVAHFTLNGQNIPFVNHVKYLSVIFDKRITWRLHIGMTEAKAFGTFIRIYSLLESERLSANIKLTFHKALIRSVMTYACATWEFRLHVPSLERFQYSKHKRPVYRINSSWAQQAVDHHR